MPAELGADAQVGDAELAACVVTLRKLADYRPAQLKREAQPGQRFAELWELGVALFGPAAVKQRFKGQDVVEFLQQQGDYRAMTRRLEKLLKQVRAHKSLQARCTPRCSTPSDSVAPAPHPECCAEQVDQLHSNRIAESTTCGINGTRIQRTKEVAAHGLAALSSAAETQRLRYGGMLLSDRGAEPEASDLDKPAAADSCGGSVVEERATAASSEAVEADKQKEAQLPADEALSELTAADAAKPAAVSVADRVSSSATSVAGGGDAASEETASTHAGAEVQGVAEGDTTEGGSVASRFKTVDELRAAFPIGSFRRVCNICKRKYEAVHHFYHQLCPPCGDFNFTKRSATADLTGYVALLTGGRVRIGYQTALRLLRAGAECHVTTRFPQDAHLRFSLEHDYSQWASRLRLYYLELCDLRAVEQFCDRLTAILAGRDRGPTDGIDSDERPPIPHGGLDIVINNAAQTLTRPEGWTNQMQKLEQAAAHQLALAGPAVVDPRVIALPQPQQDMSQLGSIDGDNQSSGPTVARDPNEIDAQPSDSSESANEHAGIKAPASSPAVPASTGGVVTRADNGTLIALDESGQPLDRSGVNSWSRRIGSVSTTELLQTMAANAAAPFILTSRLKPLLLRAAHYNDPLDSSMPAQGSRQGKEADQSLHREPAPEIDTGSSAFSDAESEIVPSDDAVPLTSLPLRSRACINAGRHLSPTVTSPCDRCHQINPATHRHRWAQGHGDRKRNKHANRQHSKKWQAAQEQTGDPGQQHSIPTEVFVPRYAHVVNVSALEGKFHVGKKSSAHPHTNMAKAALNMMTLTVAQDFAKDRILVNCVDTGWVTDMAPRGVGAKAKTHKTHVGPPLDEEDGAARVLDPIFSHLRQIYENDLKAPPTGIFYKDYRPSPW